MDAELTALLPHSIGISPFATRDAWNKKTYGTMVAYQGRVENKRRRVINANGDEVISESTIYLDTTAAIGMEDLITMPSGYLPLHPTIIAKKIEADEFGAYSVTLYV